MSNQRKHHFTVYRSYSFVDKDPIIDRIRTMISDQGVTYKKLSANSDVSAGTLWSWMAGPTKRPQFASVVAVVRSLGYDIEITEKRPGHRTTNIVMPKLKVVGGRG